MTIELLQEELAAERALTAQFNAALEDAMALAREQGETLAKQRTVIEGYERLIKTQVEPMAQFFLRQGRGNQGAFVLDGE